MPVWFADEKAVATIHRERRSQSRGIRGKCQRSSFRIGRFDSVGVNNITEASVGGAEVIKGARFTERTVTAKVCKALAPYGSVARILRVCNPQLIRGRYPTERPKPCINRSSADWRVQAPHKHIVVRISANEVVSIRLTHRRAGTRCRSDPGHPIRCLRRDIHTEALDHCRPPAIRRLHLDWTCPQLSRGWIPYNQTVCINAHPAWGTAEAKSESRRYLGLTR